MNFSYFKDENVYKATQGNHSLIVSFLPNHQILQDENILSISLSSAGEIEYDDVFLSAFKNLIEECRICENQHKFSFIKKSRNSSSGFDERLIDYLKKHYYVSDNLIGSSNNPIYLMQCNNNSLDNSIFGEKFENECEICANKDKTCIDPSGQVITEKQYQDNLKLGLYGNLEY